MSEAKVILEQAQKLHNEAEVIKTKEAKNVETICKLDIEVKFLKEKVDVEVNTKIYSTVRMTKHTSAKELIAGSTDEERKKFLTVANCVELLNAVDLKGNTTYFMEMLPLYGSEGVMFVKTDNPSTVAMQMRLYAESWDNLNVYKLQGEAREREDHVRWIFDLSD